MELLTLVLLKIYDENIPFVKDVPNIQLQTFILLFRQNCRLYDVHGPPEAGAPIHSDKLLYAHKTVRTSGLRARNTDSRFLI